MLTPFKEVQEGAKGMPETPSIAIATVEQKTE